MGGLVIDWPALSFFALGILVGALGWFAKRQITNSKADEEINRLDKTLSISDRLAEKGYSTEKVRELLQGASSGSLPLSQKTFELVERWLNENEERSFTALDTTAAMGAQLDARLEVLDAEIRELLLKLEILCRYEHWEALQEAQHTWEKFRRAEGNAAFAEMAGGTGRTINDLMTCISISEERKIYLQRLVNEKLEIYGGI